MQSYGIAHVWAQGDFVTRAIAITLLVMSVLSWIVIVIKGWNVIRLNRLTKNAEQAFWHSDNFDDGVKKLGLAASTPNDNPFLALALSGKEAADHHHQTQPHLHDRMDVSDWVTRCLKDTMDEGISRMQSGLAILASIGSTAPFVGLFGTVWGSTTPCSRSAHPARRRSTGPPGRRIADHDRLRPVRRDPGRARLQRTHPREQGCRQQAASLRARSACVFRDGREPGLVVDARRPASRDARQLRRGEPWQ